MGTSGYSNYRVLQFLGSGSYGSVDKIIDNIDNKIYALKKIKKVGSDTESFKNEVNILSMFNSDKIVKYYSSFSDKDYFYIKMEYCRCGKLANFIEEKKVTNNWINEDILYKIIYNICLGLNEIHSKNIIHRDLNPNNIFINEEYDIKIGDFGISKLCKTTHTNVGTPYYKAPELIKGIEYDNKVDIWALGCIIYELFTLKKCFDSESDWGLMDNILNNYHGKIDKKYNIKWQELIDSLLAKNNMERPKIDEVCGLVKNMKHMQIFVKIITPKKTIVLDVFPLNTINNIKKIIEDKEGIPSEDQTLISSGKQLQDTKTLQYYEISNESILHLVVKTPRKESIDNLAINVQKNTYFIFIKDLEENYFEIQVECSDTIENIKKKIKDKAGILPKQYELIFNKIKLEDNKTLKDNDIKKDSTILLMELNTIQIFVENLKGKKITIEAGYYDTIENIKKK